MASRWGDNSTRGRDAAQLGAAGVVGAGLTGAGVRTGRKADAKLKVDRIPYDQAARRESATGQSLTGLQRSHTKLHDVVAQVDAARKSKKKLPVKGRGEDGVRNLKRIRSSQIGDTHRALRSASAARQKAGGVFRVHHARKARGRALIAAGVASVPLTAVAQQVKRDFSKPKVSASRPKATLKKPKVSPKLADVRSSVKLTDEQEAKVKGALMDRGWDESPARKRTLEVKHMQGRGVS